MFLKLALQINVGFEVECHDKQATCGHVETVDNHRSSSFGMTLAHE